MSLKTSFDRQLYCSPLQSSESKNSQTPLVFGLLIFLLGLSNACELFILVIKIGKYRKGKTWKVWKKMQKYIIKAEKFSIGYKI